jgi:hypothetical protein
MAEPEFNLEKEYSKFKDKYNLPSWSNLSEDFDVNKVEEKEPTYLVRAIRRAMNEKFSAYLHLVELFINPNNPPLFVMSAMRNVNGSEKEIVKGLYKELSKMQIEVMRLDTAYDEKKEAAFVSSTFNQWQKMKPKMLQLIEKLGEGLEKEDESKKTGYFG